MKFQELCRADYSVFHELLTAYYRDGEDADTEQAVLDGFIESLFSMVMEQKIQGLFMVQNEEAVGFALWMVDTPDGLFSEIPGYGTFLEIGVSPAYRGNGFGFQAVQHVEAQMKQNGIEYFYVSVYPPADGFWTKCGYRKTEKIASNGLMIYQK